MLLFLSSTYDCDLCTNVCKTQSIRCSPLGLVLHKYTAYVDGLLKNENMDD